MCICVFIEPKSVSKTYTANKTLNEDKSNKYTKQLSNQFIFLLGSLGIGTKNGPNQFTNLNVILGGGGGGRFVCFLGSFFSSFVLQL